MKISLTIIGILASLFAISAAVQFVSQVANEQPLGTLAVSAAPICLGLFIASVCFDRAMRLAKK